MEVGHPQADHHNNQRGGRLALDCHCAAAAPSHGTGALGCMWEVLRLTLSSSSAARPSLPEGEVLTTASESLFCHSFDGGGAARVSSSRRPTRNAICCRVSKELP